MRALSALWRCPANLPNLRLCIILAADARWPFFGGQRPCSGVACASQDARLSFLFIREHNHSTIIIDKVAFSTRCVPANHLLTRLSNSLQTPTWVWVNPERGAARRNRAPMVGFSFEDVGFKLELGAPWPFVVGLRRDPSPRADRRANASSGEREPTRSGYPRACRQRSISHCFW